MIHVRPPRIACVAASIGLALFCTTVAAESVSVEGLIKARNGETMTVQTAGNPNLVVVLTDKTEVGQVQGVLKIRKKGMSMAALIPGLTVKIEGTYNETNQLVAQKVSFKGDDLERAQAIQAGVHESSTQVQQNKQAIDATNVRFDQLDNYSTLAEVTVYFANGKSKVESEYASQLLEFAEKAKAVDGYNIEVKGYTSTVGSAALNQQLSEDRASEVANILIQKGHIPLSRMLAVGAMGESNPVGNDKTAEGQASSRRVVVRVLQNKAIAGK